MQPINSLKKRSLNDYALDNSADERRQKYLKVQQPVSELRNSIPKHIENLALASSKSQIFNMFRYNTDSPSPIPGLYTTFHFQNLKKKIRPRRSSDELVMVPLRSDANVYLSCIEKLPDEILLSILQKCIKTLSDFRRLSRVCKRFKSIIKTAEVIQGIFDLPITADNNLSAHVEFLLNYGEAAKNLKLAFEGFAQYQPDTFKNIVAACAGLSSITFNMTPKLTNDHLTSLTGATNLRSLSLNSCPIEVDNQALADLILCTSLQNLTISGCHIEAEGISLLGDWSNLQTLSLKEFTFRAWQNNPLLNLKHLQQLTVLHVSIPDHFYAALESWDNLSYLKTDERRAAAFMQFAKCTSLTTLILLDCESLNDHSLASFSSLTRLAALKLKRCNNLNDDQTLLLKKLTALKSLSLFRDNGYLTSEGLNRLWQCSSLVSLKAFDFWRTAARPLPSTAFKKISGLVSLKKLHLGFGLKDDTILEELKQMSRLENLSLKGNSLSSNALPVIAGLKKLHTLDISETSAMTESGFTALQNAELLRNLVIDKCSALRDEHLIDLQKLPRLQYLSMEFNQQITLEGMKYAVACPNLRKLHALLCSPITVDEHAELCKINPKMSMQYSAEETQCTQEIPGE